MYRKIKATKENNGYQIVEIRRKCSQENKFQILLHKITLSGPVNWTKFTEELIIDN